MSAGGATIAVVIVTYNSADGLASTLSSVTDQLVEGDRLIVVDNLSTDGSAEIAREWAHEVVETGANTGFAGGCNVGAARTSSSLLLFLNPDARLTPGSLEALRATERRRSGWGAWQAVVTMQDGAFVNTAGNCVHFLGFGWAGDLDHPIEAVLEGPREVGFASGAALVVRREAWDSVGGFDERYFMYGEDLDLCLRLRLAGWGIGVQPAAQADHDYSFEKGDYKWFYLERNRWWTVLGVYPGVLLALMWPALLAFEVALLFASWRGGWLRAKLRSQAAVARELPQILARRRTVQATRRVSAREFATGFTTSLDSPHLAMAHSIPGAVPVQAAFFAGLRRLLPS